LFFSSFFYSFFSHLHYVVKMLIGLRGGIPKDGGLDFLFTGGVAVLFDFLVDDKLTETTTGGRVHVGGGTGLSDTEFEAGVASLINGGHLGLTLTAFNGCGTAVHLSFCSRGKKKFCIFFLEVHATKCEEA